MGSWLAGCLLVRKKGKLVVMEILHISDAKSIDPSVVGTAYALQGSKVNWNALVGSSSVCCCYFRLALNIEASLA